MLHAVVLTIGPSPSSNRRAAHPLKSRVLDGDIVVETVDGDPVAAISRPLAFADRQTDSPFHEQ